ncbi:hypothetical protein [Streptomyces curacoi]|uniref:hypothetical protein n=1 Tax=Streptomyces curacoi TaxID=146536 RepID=UPI001AC00259|nr:hypothetical protein [Streptomyces curacoi]
MVADTSPTPLPALLARLGECITPEKVRPNRKEGRLSRAPGPLLGPPPRRRTGHCRPGAAGPGATRHRNNDQPQGRQATADGIEARLRPVLRLGPGSTVAVPVDNDGRTDADPPRDDSAARPPRLMGAETTARAREQPPAPAPSVTANA